MREKFKRFLQKALWYTSVFAVTGLIVYLVINIAANSNPSILGEIDDTDVPKSITEIR